MVNLMRLLGVGLCITFQLSIKAQDTMEKKFEFENESDSATIVIQVEPGMSGIAYEVSSEISEGSLEVKLVDPQKNGKGKFTLETAEKGSNSYAYKTKAKSKSKTKTKTVSKSSSSSASSSADSDGSYSYTMISSDNSSVKGNMHKEFDGPTPGIWRIEIYPKKVTGKVELKVRVY